MDTIIAYLYNPFPFQCSGTFGPQQEGVPHVGKTETKANRMETPPALSRTFAIN